MPVLLIVVASPSDQDRLRLGREVQEIKNALSRSRNREQWRVESNEAATVDELRRAMLDLHPTIVHFSGHGGQSGLCFEDLQGNSHIPQIDAVARLFHHFKTDLQCVVLNACYSDDQAAAICQEIDYVVGMSDEIDDNIACKYAVAFYDAIFSGSSFRSAFELGGLSIDLNGLPQSKVPVFKTSPRVGGETLRYSEDVPLIESAILTYLNTPFADRWQLTTRGEAIKEAMLAYYAGKAQPVAQAVQFAGKEQLDGEHWRILVNIQAPGGRSAHQDFYVRIHGRSVLLDWEATAGLWSIPPNVFKANGADGDVVARVRAELDDHYSGFAYNKGASYQSVCLRAESGGSFYGYVPRKSDLQTKLLEVLANGDEHRITIRLRGVDQERDKVLITDLVSKSWIVD